MLLQIFENNIDDRKLTQVVDCLKKGGLVIYPTDTVYALGCDIYNKSAIEKICAIKGIKPNKINFSIICNDLSHITDFTVNVDTPTYKRMKRCLPGPFTFILKANNQVPKLFKNNKRTIGIRVPDNKIPLAIVQQLGNPIVTTSIHHEDDIIDYITDPMAIYERYENVVDIVIDGGIGGLIPSTIVDCTETEPIIVRQGAGDIDLLY
ncbi:MAG: threonylcarbamoyl-AMP synthase [Chitinophagales bacterium]|nr:threonylcarbamoyl-AMP synthase [Chitinophagales bacterium]